MSQDAALVQLVDMGIPGGRARAALRRSKGDVMSAAVCVVEVISIRRATIEPSS